MENINLAIKVFDDNAKAYHQKFKDVSLYHEALNFFCENVPTQNASVLELACGPGNITKYLLSIRPDMKIHGLDMSAKMVEIAQEHNPKAYFRVMDMRKIGFIPEKYNAIINGFGLPYINIDDVEKLIKDSTKVLKKKGILYLSTMEAHYEKSGLKTSPSGNIMYMHYYM